jgi:hypothetical protein
LIHLLKEAKMKITVKTLKGQNFNLEVGATDKVSWSWGFGCLLVKKNNMTYHAEETFLSALGITVCGN